MAQDMKYGQVTLEKGHVPDDLPVVVFRGDDALLLSLLAAYQTLCSDAGSPKHHLDLIVRRRREIMHWQEQHLDEVHIPRSDGYHRAHPEG